MRCAQAEPAGYSSRGRRLTISATVLAIAMLGSSPEAVTAPAAIPAAQVPLPAPPADAAPPVEAAPPVDGASAAPPPAASSPQGEGASASRQPAGSEIIVTARQGPPPGDPLERVNETSFKAVQAVDKVFVGPVAHTYEKGVPEPIRDGVHNALNNLSEPVNFINFMLQLKPGKALQALARFAINSTVGVAGVFDIAKRKPFRIKYRRNGFANTFGYYGIKPGPFLFLPLIGPTTPRDLIGRILDLSVLPLAGKPFNDPTFTLVTGTLRSIDDRVEFDALFSRMRNDCPNYYAAEREWYLQTRKAEIEQLHGRTYDVDQHLPDCLVQSPAAAPTPVGPVPVQPPAAATPAAPAAASPAPAAAPDPAPVPPAPQPAASPAPVSQVQPATTATM